MRFDAWCAENIRPWYLDHVYWDATIARRFRRRGLDLDARIPSDVICAASEVDPSIMPMVAPYMGMMALPGVLDPLQERTREILRTGWRPSFGNGPSRDELVQQIRADAVR